MKKKKVSTQQIELLIKLASLLREYDVTIECGDFGIDVDIYRFKSGNGGIEIDSVNLPDSFTQYEIGDMFEEWGISKEVKEKMDAEEPGSYDRLFTLVDGEF